MKTLKLQKSYEENAYRVVENVLNLLDVKVSEATLKMIQHLPGFPSLSALRLAFNEFGIETFAARLTMEQLLEMAYPAIAHLNRYEGCFVIIGEIAEGKITYHDAASGWITESLDQFTQQWTGVILLLETTQQAGEINYAASHKKEMLSHVRKAGIITLSTVLLLAGFMISSNFSELALKILLLLGAGCCVLLIASAYDNAFIQSLCPAGKKTDCHRVLHSSAATLFGWLKLTDIGLIWFAGSFMTCLLGDLTGHQQMVMHALFLIHIPAMAFVPFSVAYQALKVRRWCTICLAVQGVLLSDIVVLSSYATNVTEIFSDHIALYCLLAGFTTVSLLWLWMNPIIHAAQQLPYRQQELYKMKRDPEVFKNLLQNSRTVETLPLPLEFRLGLEHAPVQLTVATNPFCEPCRKAHPLLESLYHQMSDQLSITFRFYTRFDDVYDEGRIFAIHFLSLPCEQMAGAYRDWIALGDYEQWAPLYPANMGFEAEAMLREHQLWCDWAMITKTPAFFLNNFETPEQFTPEELVYHIKNFEPAAVIQPDLT